MYREFSLDPFEWFTESHHVVISTKTRVIRGVDPKVLENWAVAKGYQIYTGDTIVFRYG